MPGIAESAAAKLAWEMESWRAIELLLHDDYTNYAPPNGAMMCRSFHDSQRYIETASGRRLYESAMAPDYTEDVMIEIRYGDGSRCADLLRTDKEGSTGRAQVTIKRSFSWEAEGQTHRPGPLKYLYVGLKPLHQVLGQAQPLGEGRWIGRDCDRFLFTRVKGPNDPVNWIYWLDRETGLTLHVEYFADDQAWSKGRPVFFWNAESLDTVDGGHHFVLKSELLDFGNGEKGTGPQHAVRHYKTVVDEIAFDREYSQAVFWPIINENTSVHDEIKKTVVWGKRPTKATKAAEPIRAVDPLGGPSYSMVALFLGAAVLAAGVLMWWRRR